VRCQSNPTTSCADGVVSCDKRSTTEQSSATKPPSSSRRSQTSSFPLEILTLKWVSMTPTETAKLIVTVREMMRALHKVTSPEFPGWAVVWNIYSGPTTTRLVFHVEPEAELLF